MARHSHVFSGFGLDDAAGLAAGLVVLGCSVIPPPYDASQQWLLEDDVFKGKRTTFPQQLVSLPTQNSETKEISTRNWGRPIMLGTYRHRRSTVRRR